ncbi:uncharacterized protein PAC_12763 [Phialocephala subalpina]|uniref:Uncharacterized protein n=1 Tax=Phialocephala subalpina TaxID=576137 RepID=A0A1L7XCZ6_9HELO|nr:uncharacterized protein PAC_12763 [Phialocephala subalpina]
MPPKVPPPLLPLLLPRIPQAIAYQPAPFNPTESVQDTLLPWLAMGWTPIFTPGGGAGLCGYHALCNSMVAAMDLFHLPGRQPIVESLQELQIERHAREPNHLESESLRVLLELANEEFQTNFDLGIITEGYRVRWERRDTGQSGFNRNFIALTGVQHNSQHRNRPTIRIWNDGEEERMRAHRPGTNVTPHWESFGPPLASSRSGRRRVRNWNLGAMVRADIEAGVYVVTEEIRSFQRSQRLPSSPGSAPPSPDASVFAHVGHFVRPQVIPRALDVPADHIYVRLCRSTSYAPGVEEQTVLRASIQQIVPHESAPEPDLDPESRSDPPWRGIPVQATSAGIGRQVPFRIVRCIAVANKIGGAIADERGPNFDALDGFNTAIGDFFLDSLSRPNELAVITNIAGIQGHVQLRKLQDLKGALGLVVKTSSAPRWIGDVDIPAEFYRIVLGDKSTHGAMTVNQGLSNKPTLRPLPSTLGGGRAMNPLEPKANVTRAIQDIIAKSVKPRVRARAIGGLTLPLFTLNRAIPAARTQRTPFLTGEIVRLWDSTPDRDGNVRILDYEGHEGSIMFDQLTAIDTAFGLTLNETQAPDEFRTNGQPLVPLAARSNTTQRPPEKQCGSSPAGNSASSNYQANHEVLAQLATLDPNEAEDIITTSASEAGRMTANVNVALRVGLGATRKRRAETVHESARVQRQRVDENEILKGFGVEFEGSSSSSSSQNSS